VTEPGVTVELLGLARHRAGRKDLYASGRTVADVLRVTVRTCPGLAGLITPDGSLSRQYLVSLDGERFIDDPAEPVPAGCRVLILGADAGG
jgi:hypothetical protein